MDRSAEEWALARSIHLTPTHEQFEPGCAGVWHANWRPVGDQDMSPVDVVR